MATAAASRTPAATCSLRKREARCRGQHGLAPTLCPPRRGGRVVECTGLENRRRGNSSAGSNPAPSALDVACLLGFWVLLAELFRTAGDRLTPLKTGPQ